MADDFYDVIIKPRIRKCFEGLDKKISGVNSKAKKLFMLAIWHQAYDVVVCVSVVGNDFSEIVSQLDLVGTVHQNALNRIKAKGVSAPVHHYQIERGAVNAEPLMLASIDEILKS